MNQILLALVVGVVAGAALLAQKRFTILRKIQSLLMPILYVFLALIGFGVGLNKVVLENILQIGLQSLLIASAGILGSMLLASWVVKMLPAFQIKVPTGSRRGQASLASLRTSAKILLGFVGGVGLGLMVTGLVNLRQVANGTTLVLTLLMLTVGINVGGDRGLLRAIKGLNPKLLLLPCLTILGTLMGTALISPLLPAVSTTQAMGVGAGFGCYSISSAIFGQVAGPSLAITALFANLLREIATILLAPLVVSSLGPIALISMGGTTSCSSALPTISVFTGRDLTCLAVVHGVVIQVLVPMLVTLLAGMGHGAI